MNAKQDRMTKDFLKAIMTPADKTQPYDTEAEVVRIEDETAWVHIAGGVDETPVKMTIDAKKGDTVQVRVSGGDAWLVGNATAPPTDDTTALKARVTAIEADLNAKNAKKKADDAYNVAENAQDTADDAHDLASQAKTIADDTNQYFWFTSEGTDTGAHITEVPQDDWNDSTSASYHSGGNLLARSNGIAVRNGLTELATFGSTEANIGGTTGRHTTIDTGGLKVYDSDTLIGQIGYGSGTTSSGTTATAPFYTLGTRSSGSDVGNYSVAEGRNTIASGFASHAEGNEAHATGSACHAEGSFTIASNGTSHAEGMSAIASGFHSHAEGSSTLASGYASHAQNNYTIAGYDNQTAIGRYNDNKSGNALEIGNGYRESIDVIVRSNALEIDWNGNVHTNGDVNIATGKSYKINGTALSASDVGAVPTTRTVNSKALSSNITLTASDVSAVPTTRTVNSKALSSNITLDITDISGAGAYTNSGGEQSDSVASGTSWVNTSATLSLTADKKYILIAHASFGTNATGRRGLRMYSSATSSDVNRTTVNTNATSGANTHLECVGYLAPTANTTVTVQVYQNSGNDSLTVKTDAIAIRIG